MEDSVYNPSLWEDFLDQIFIPPFGNPPFRRIIFELGLHTSHHLKNNPPKGRIPKRWDKNLVQEIFPEERIINRVLLIEGYLHISTFYSDLPNLESRSEIVLDFTNVFVGLAQA